MKFARTDIRRTSLTLAALMVALVASGCSKTSDAASRATTAATQSSGAVDTTASVDTTATDAPTQATPSAPALARPASSRVEAFDGSSLIAAFQGQRGANVNQADALEYALFSAQTGLQCDAVKNDFATDFAAHRSIANYVRRLTSHAKPMPLSSVDLPMTLGQYDFNGGHFQIAPNYGDGSKTFEFNYTHNCQTTWSAMPDASNAYDKVDLEADNGAPLHIYPIAAHQGESIAQSAPQYTFTEHLVFYPVTIARRDGGQLGAVVHVTKVALERRPDGAPQNAVPTVLMTRSLP